ncbi:hypothetical protein ACJ77P_12300 [Syntrophus buswellii]|uniref:hypothetical protein n=1 Tax=Syntrophus buswellii TaxID=43774 RepID=UPI0038D4930A
MQPLDFVLFAHGAFDKGITGRTVLQKIVYFLSVIIGEDLGYNPHFYGPYSPKVAEANSELKELNYVEETSTVYGYNNQGFEMTKYDYSLTDDGLKLLERKKKQYNLEWEQILTIANRIKSAGNMHYMELAMAAKAFMIIKQQGGISNKEIIKTKAKQLGWLIDDRSLDNALSFLEKIEIVTWN